MKLNAAAVAAVVKKGKISLSNVTFEQGDTLPAFTYNGETRIGFTVESDKQWGEHRILLAKNENGDFRRFRVENIRFV